MEKVNYSTIYTSLTKGLSDKTKEVFARRFGIGSRVPETLESIGQSMGVTRERVRQIQDAGFVNIKNEKKDILEKALKDLSMYLKGKGGFRREDLILADLGQNNARSYILFLLTLGEQFSRICEKKDFYAFWAMGDNGETTTGKFLASLASDLKKIGKPVVKKEFVAQFASKYNLSQVVLGSYLEASKNIKENSEGKVGLVDWPEISPRGVRDKSFLVFQKENKPLHFTKVASLIDSFNYNLPNRKTLPQTVHNELIKDERFVLVGRGIYALKQWGYHPGTVRDVIVKTIADSAEPLDREILLQKVLSQRMVAKNTVLMNLNDKKLFAKNDKGRYILRKTQTA